MQVEVNDFVRRPLLRTMEEIETRFRRAEIEAARLDAAVDAELKELGYGG